MANDGTFIEKSGFFGVDELAKSLIVDLLTDGYFTQIYPTTPFTETSTDKTIILQPTIKVNPVTTEPWQIKFKWEDRVTKGSGPTAKTYDGYMDVYVATDKQFNANTGEHTSFIVDPNQPSNVEALGILGSQLKTYFTENDGENPSIIQDFPQMSFSHDEASKTFLWRKDIPEDQIKAHPLAYNVSITNRGLAVSVYDERSDEDGNRNSWFVVQRPVYSTPVYNTTGSTIKYNAGETVIDGKRPVHCIYSLSGVNIFKPWLPEEYQRTFVGFPWQVVSDALNTSTDADDKKAFWEKVIKGLSASDKFAMDSSVIPSSVAPTTDLTTWTGISEAYRTIPKVPTYCIRRFVVRERDITAPYPTQLYIKDAITNDVEGVEGLDYSEIGSQFGVPADRHTVDYSAIMNSKQQVSIGEGNKYIVTFPNGLNTARFAYTHEMDMIAYTSADVVSAGSEIPVPVYGEEEARIYSGMNANGPNNTGMRVLFLKQGGGIPEPTVV